MFGCCELCGDDLIPYYDKSLSDSASHQVVHIVFIQGIEALHMCNRIFSHIPQDYLYLDIGLELCIKISLLKIRWLLGRKPERDIETPSLGECLQKEQSELGITEIHRPFVYCYYGFLPGISPEPHRHDPSYKYVNGFLQGLRDPCDIHNNEIRTCIDIRWPVHVRPGCIDHIRFVQQCFCGDIFRVLFQVLFPYCSQVKKRWPVCVLPCFWVFSPYPFLAINL